MLHEYHTYSRRFDKLSPSKHFLMTRTTRCALLIAALMLTVILAPVTPVQAAETVDLSATQGVVGGLRLSVSESSQITTMTATLTEMPRIVEVYTATWCENCVGAEHALDESVEGKYVTMLVFHRFIGETQDPFGTQEGDDRWIQRYGTASQESVGLGRAPPTMVFDGCRVKAGTAASGDSLLDDYQQLLGLPLPSAGAVSSSLSWDGNNSSGVVTWQFSAGDTASDDSDYVQWTHRLLVVEESAYYPEGGNGLNNYTNIVRQVTTLELPESETTEFNAQVAVDLPAAWDGDDLSLVLVHEWKSEEHSLGDLDEGGIGTIFASAVLALIIGVLAIVVVIIIVAIVIVVKSKKQQSSTSPSGDTQSLQ